MVDKIEMSLDDIIKFSKLKVGGGNRKGFGQRRGGSPRKGNRQSGGGGGGSGYRGGKRNSNMGGGPGGGGGVLKGRNQGIQKAKFNRGDMNSEWKHDLYEVPKRGGFRNFGNSGGPGGVGNSAKLLVSNLDYGVSESDIQELFADFGPLKSASVHYDRSGRSLGTADVVFERRSDAVKAMKQYNGVPLDGRPMVILLATSELPSQQSFNKAGRLGGGGQRSPQKSSNWKFGSGGYGGPRRNGQSNSGGARQSGGWKQSTKTIEELDAELDAYVNDMK